MNRHLLAALVILMLVAVAAASQGQTVRKPAEVKLPPLTVLSIIPAQGEPGAAVTLNGTGFTVTTTAVLGSRELPATVVGGRILSFVLPDVPSGVYALYLKREDGATSRPYNFVVQPLKPVATSLSPDTVSNCAAGREREVVLSGANFQNGTRVLFDGAAIGARIISASALAFFAPQVTPGLHQVQVQNASDAVSGTLALFLDSRPEIQGVTIGSDYVSYYEIVVSGRNFHPGSSLMADGARIGTGKPAVGERDQLVYLGCTQLVYQRHPYDPTPKEIRLQVVNPTGEESNIFAISAP